VLGLLLLAPQVSQGTAAGHFPISANAASSEASSDCTFFVATTGDDANNGKTETASFRTIHKAADSVQPGDVVCVRGGTYPGFTVTKSGTASQPITFRAYPGEKPLINKPGGNDYIYITDQSHIILDGLTFDSVFVQIYGKKAGYNRIINCESRNGGGAIGIYWGHHNLIKNCKIYNKVSDNYPRGKATLTGTGIWGAGVMFARGATHNIIEDSYIYWIHGEGIAAFNAAHGSIIRRNVIEGAWSANVYVDGSKDVTVDSNLIYLTPEAKTWPSIDPHRGNWSNSLGIGVSVECAGSGACYYEDAGERSVDNLTIANNIVVNVNGGIWLFKNDNPFVASGWRVINNTFINNDNGIYLTGVEVRNSIFKNNIVVQNNGGYQVHVALPGIGNEFSNNLYFGSSQRFKWGSVESDFAGWRTATGETNSQWIDPKLVNPAMIPPRLWDDPSLAPAPRPQPSRLNLAEPYKLSAFSPAIDAGTSQSAPASDFEGNSRPQGAGYDLGADEFLPADSTTFADVPASHWAYADIEKLYRGGYVVGCQVTPERKYCPEATLTRAEAAVFVVRGVHGGGFLPQQPASPVFADVALGDWFAKWADALWQERFTAGCAADPLAFCPLQPHSRAEGAVFFLRMLRGKDYVPPQPSSLFYSDVALDAWYAKWVAAAYEAGLTRDCEDPANRSDDRFRPEEAITRAEAACMMVKAKGLP